MNDKQKEIALKMAVVRARMSLEYLDTKDYIPLKKELAELLAAFDAAADAPKPSVNDLYYIYYNDKFVWGGHGWTAASGFGYGYPKETADMIYAGLVATGNVPEVGE